MKRLAIAGLILSSFAAHAEYTPEQLASSFQMIGAMSQMNKLPLTIYNCSQKADNGFITPDVINYVQAFDHKQNVGAIYMGALNGDKISMNGDIFIYDNLEGLKEGYYDYSKTNAIRISGIDNTDINVYLKNANTEEQYQCSLNEKLTAQSNEEYRMSHPSAATIKRNKEIAAQAEREWRRTHKKEAAEQDAEKKRAADGVDDLLGDLSTGNNAPKAPTQHHVSGGASGADVSGYVAQIQNAVNNKVDRTYLQENYKGKSCAVQIGIASDGTLQTYSQKEGDQGLCNYVMSALSNISKLPRPPSEAVYQVMKLSVLNFRY